MIYMVEAPENRTICVTEEAPMGLQARGFLPFRYSGTETGGGFRTVAIHHSNWGFPPRVKRLVPDNYTELTIAPRDAVWAHNSPLPGTVDTRYV